MTFENLKFNSTFKPYLVALNIQHLVDRQLYPILKQKENLKLLWLFKAPKIGKEKNFAAKEEENFGKTFKMNLYKVLNEDPKFHLMFLEH